MLLKNRNISYLLIVTLFIIIQSCDRSSDPEIPPTTLEITVTDSNSDPIEGALVNLYTDLDSWLLEENSVVPPGQTDTDGIAAFPMIDTGTYFIDIQKNELNNWESGAKKDVFPNVINVTTIDIFESNSGKLSSAEGKVWNLTGFKRNDIDVYDFLDECEQDTRHIFYKGPTLGSVTLTPGDLKCDDSEPDQEEGFWSFTPDQASIEIELPFSSLRWTIEELTSTTLRISYIDTNTGFFIEETYTAE